MHVVAGGLSLVGSLQIAATVEGNWERTHSDRFLRKTIDLVRAGFPLPNVLEHRLCLALAEREVKVCEQDVA